MTEHSAPGPQGEGSQGSGLTTHCWFWGKDGGSEEMYCTVLYRTVLYLADVAALAVWVPHTLGLAPGDGVWVGDEAGLNKYF